MQQAGDPNVRNLVLPKMSSGFAVCARAWTAFAKAG
jgi:hypothetical protein